MFIAAYLSILLQVKVFSYLLTNVRHYCFCFQWYVALHAFSSSRDNC